MRGYLAPLLELQRFFIPCLIVLVAWATWRTVVRKDAAIGLALYLSLVVIVDGYLNTGISLPGLEKGSIRYSEVCAFFLLINRPRAARHIPNHRTVTFLVLFYFTLLVLSALRTEPIGFFDIRALIIPQIIAFFLAMRGLDSSLAYRRFLLGLTVLVIIIGLFSFWDIFYSRIIIKSNVLNEPEYWRNRAQGRYGSFFLNPNYLGAFVVLAFPVTLIQALCEQTKWSRLFAWVGCLSMAFSLIETQSRGPLLVFAVIIMALVLLPSGGVSRMRKLGFLTVLLTVFIIVLPGFYQHAAKRFQSFEREIDLEAVSRKAVWIYTLRIISDHPLGGIGFGESQYIKTMEAYGFAEHYGAASLDNPHNSYMQIAVYAGLPALASFLLANGMVLARTMCVSPRRSEDAAQPIAMGLGLGITGFLVTIYPDMQLFTRTVAPVYWVFFGLLLDQLTRTGQGELE